MLSFLHMTLRHTSSLAATWVMRWQHPPGPAPREHHNTEATCLRCIAHCLLASLRRIVVILQIYVGTLCQGPLGARLSERREADVANLVGVQFETLARRQRPAPKHGGEGREADVADLVIVRW